MLGQPPDVPAVSFLTTALWDDNYSHFTEEETESGRAIQVVRELVLGNGNPLQNSCLENPMDREAW